MSPQSPPVRAGLGHIPALDGMRAVAVLAVLAYHLDRLPGGFFGVDVFFVISGFLITRLLIDEHARNGVIRLRSFWNRRFKRLLPALVVVLVAVAIGSRLWLPAWRLGEIRLDGLASLAYVANWRFVISGQSYFATGVPPSPLRHMWSLAIEEQFYVVWPLLVVGIVRLRVADVRRWVGVAATCAAVASAAWMAIAASMGMDLSRIYYGTDTRLFALLGGAALGAWWETPSPASVPRVIRRRSADRWAMVAAAVLVPVVAFFVFGSNSDAAMYQGGFQALALCAVVLVAAVSRGRGQLTMLLAHPVLVWIGRRSYGIYLWSWPTQVVLAEHVRVEGVALDASVVVISFGLAALSFWLIETPIRSGTRPTGLPRKQAIDQPPTEPRSAVRSLALVSSAMVLAAAVIVITATGAPRAPSYTSISDEEVLAEALGDITESEAEALREAPTTSAAPIDEGPPGPFTGAPGVLVDPSASIHPALRLGRPLNVMVAGDSVGWSLGWATSGKVGESVAIDDAALIACGLMPPTSKFIVQGRDPEQYGEGCQSADVVEIAALGRAPDVVLLWLGAWEVYDHELDGVTLRVGSDRYAQVLEARLQERIDKYRGAGVATVLPVVPCFAPNAARLGSERLDATRVDWVNERIRSVAERNTGWVRLVDPASKLCDASGVALRATPDGVPLREDGAHFDAAAAAWFWDSWLIGQMGAAFEVAR